MAAAIGAIAGGAIGSAGMDMVGQWTQYGMEQDMASYATRRARQAYQNRYRWTMHDMKEAGLNPILAYQTMAGGAPTGMMGHVSSSNLGSSAREGARLGGLLGEQMRNVRMDTWLKNAQENVAVSARELNKAQTNKTEVDALVRIVEGQEAAARALLYNAQTKRTDTENMLLGTQIPSAKAMAEFDKSPIGQFLRQWNRGVEGLGVDRMIPRVGIGIGVGDKGYDETETTTRTRGGTTTRTRSHRRR